MDQNGIETLRLKVARAERLTEEIRQTKAHIDNLERRIDQELPIQLTLQSRRIDLEPAAATLYLEAFRIQLRTTEETLKAM